MVDHGAPGFVAFPNKTDHLHREELWAALETMQSRRMYNHLVFYLEACESGAMFENMTEKTNIRNVYVTTAANTKESSFGTYCGKAAEVNNQSVKSCLGDLYSVNWMANAETVDLLAETLQQQYVIVRNETNKSHVMQYGDMSMASEPAGMFECVGKRNRSIAGESPTIPADAGAVDARDTVLAYLSERYRGADSASRAEAAAALAAHIAARKAADRRFAAIAAAAVPGMPALAAAAPLLHRVCHVAAHRAVTEYCGGYDDYSLKYARTMVNVCEALSGDTAKVVDAVRRVCTK